MPKIRTVYYDGRDWRLSELARAHNILPQTLARRLKTMPVGVAVSAPILTYSEAGRRGYRASCWRDD